MARSRPLFLASFAAIAAVGTLAVGSTLNAPSALDARLLQSSSTSPSALHKAAVKRKVLRSSSSSSAAPRFRPRDRDMIQSYGGRSFSSVSYVKAGCGDKLILDEESCDDGNTRNGDGCSASCTQEAGFVCFGQPSSCHTRCGDGVANGSEYCDDGNIEDGDGCSSSCHLEFGYTCTAAAPNVCTLLSGSSSSSS